MGPRRRFLADVEASLPLPDALRHEVVEELDAHLADTVADLVARGADQAEAERNAIQRLGSATALGRELGRAHRGADRLLAAAGGGVWAGVRTAVPAAFVASVVVVLATILVVVVARAIGLLLGHPIQLSTNGGWNTALSAMGLDVAALLAGAAAVRGAARAGWRTAAEVRPGVMLVGGSIAAFLALVAISAPMNWASVAALGAVPVSFAIGAQFERLRGPSGTVFLATVAVVVLLTVGVGAVLGRSGATFSGGSGYSWDTRTHGYEMIGAWWQDPSTDQAPDFPQTDFTWRGTGIEDVLVAAASPTVLSGFHDIRLEAWRAEPPGEGWRLVPGQRAPFATAATISDRSATVAGTLTFNETPGVDWAQVVVTGARSDGTRYILAAGGPEQTEFHGNVFAWFAALLR